MQGGHQVHSPSGGTLARQAGATDLGAARLRLGLARAKMGFRYLGKKQEQDARVAFERGGQTLLELATLDEKDWPGHPRVALMYQYAGQVYSALPTKHADAATYYRKSLAIYERDQGPSGDDVKKVVSMIAELLRGDKMDA